jgi:hypothetical protein
VGAVKVDRVNSPRLPILTGPGGLGGSASIPALDDLTDVDTTGVADGDTIVFDSGSGTWVPGSGGTSTGGMVPYYIAADDTFTVPLYKQALFKDTIEVDGILVVLGRLLGVD